MSSLEHLASALDLLTQIELATSQPAYRRFYETYRGDDTEGLLIDGRVLHFGDTGTRSTHLIVRELFDEIQVSLGRTDHHIYVYNPDEYVVATTDGIQMQQWRIEHVQGVHDGRVDTILHRYVPANEVMEFTLADETSSTRARLAFNRVSGAGVMCVDGNYGWILSAEESREEREAVLKPAPSIGRLAITS